MPSSPVTGRSEAGLGGEKSGPGTGVKRGLWSKCSLASVYVCVCFLYYIYIVGINIDEPYIIHFVFFEALVLILNTCINLYLD